MRLLFDMDGIKFKAAACAEDRSVIVTHKETGDWWEFKTRTEFHGKDKKSNFLLEYNLSKDMNYSLDDFVIQDKQTLRSFINYKEVTDSLIGGICKKLGCKDYYGYLGKGVSFRENYSHMQKYKGERTKMIRPLLLEDVGKYIQSSHNAEVVEGLEADDWVSIDSQEAFSKWKKTKSDDDKLILLSVDKDSRTHPGWLFNYDTMTKPLKVDGFGKLYKEENSKPNGYGRLFFYFFLLNGDKSDGYSPTHLLSVRFGEQSAYKLLVNCKNDKEALQVVVNTYQQWFPNSFTFKSWRGEDITYSWIDVLQEIWDLAFMVRYEGQRVIVKDVLDKLGVRYV